MQLKIEHLTKKYKNHTAVNDMDFVLTEGIYGLLGPNGAGKSTLMKLLVGNLKPTSGRILYQDTPIERLNREYKRQIGYMPQQQELYPFYTGWEFLRYMGLLKGVDKSLLDKEISDLAYQVNLHEVMHKKIGTDSGGMKQRLLIAQAFLGNPRIMIFDEPTAGLDPKERIHVRNLIADNVTDKIILIATHVVQDIEYIANEIMLVKEGRLLDKAAPDVLIDKVDGKVYEIMVPAVETDTYRRSYLVSGAIRQANQTQLRIICDQGNMKDAVPVRPNLEDVYLYEFGGEGV